MKDHGLRATGVGTNIGTASSLAFGVKQGLELVDPKARAEAARKAQVDQDRWFKGGGFTQVGGATAVPSGDTAKKDGFKVPALPARRTGTGG